MFRALVLTLFATSLAVAQQPESREYHTPVLIRVEGVINPWLQHYVLRKIERAKSLGCDLLIFEIDSPGGGAHETLKLCDAITELSGMHTVAFVPREALSGGAILALSCDEIIVGEMARIGDAGLIEQVRDMGFQYVDEKFRSHLVLRVRALAENQGHPPALAEAMVDKSIKVVRVRLPDGVERLHTDRELAANPAMANWERLETVGESGDNRFLALLGRRAKELGLASANVDSRPDLTKHFELQQPPVVLESNSVDLTAALINTWLVTGLLLVIGLVALAYELSAPGVGVGGLVAGLCFALFFWARFLGGTSGWLEVVLFAAGVVFLAVELFLIPGFGVAGIAGLLMIFVSIVLASQEHLIPSTREQFATTAGNMATAVVSGFVGLVICAVAARNMASLPMLNRLMLKPPMSSEPAEIAATNGKGVPLAPTVAVGDVGVAATLLRPGGKVQFGDHQILDVVSDGSFLPAGATVRVVEIQGSRIVVERSL